MARYQCKKYARTELFARIVLAMNGCTNLLATPTVHHGQKRTVVSGVSFLDETTYMVIVDERGTDNPETVKMYRYKVPKRLHLNNLDHE